MIHSIPTYLKGLATEVDSKILAEIQSNYGENSTAFKLDKKFKSIERTWLPEYEEFGQTVWGTTIDNKIIGLFDPTENGYNGMFDLNEVEDFEESKTIDFKNGIDLILAFQYGGEEAEFAKKGKSQFAEDYFDWLAIYKLDNGKLEEIDSIECA